MVNLNNLWLKILSIYGYFDFIKFIKWINQWENIDKRFNKNIEYEMIVLTSKIFDK